MEEKERQQITYLIVLICCTAFTVILLGESVLLGWERSTVLLLLMGVLVCWWAHITKKFSPEVNLYINVGLTLIAFFFYGSHETSIYDLAPAMLFGMLVYGEVEKKRIIDLFMITYTATMVYDFLFVIDGIGGQDPVVITRIMLHFGLIYIAGYIIKLGIQRRKNDRKSTQEKIAELAETNRRTEDFLTNVSHELRTPINAVTGITATMLKKERDSARRRDIYAIQLAGQRLFNQVEDILDFTEIDTGHVKISEDVYMVSSLINDVINANIVLNGESPAELIVNLEPTMPSALSGDARKIKKILNHLIHNGMKFTKEGAVYVKLYAMKKPYGVNLCIKVKDTGTGIAEEELSRIKERFYQSNSGRNRKAGGLGLGLSIVYGLVSAMEGFIQIESEPGRGTEVTVSIPQKIADAETHMNILNKEELCLACFIEPEKYTIPEVRTFYNEIISDMVKGMELPIWRVSSIDELMNLVGKYQLTHLFVGKEEFQKNRTELDRLDAAVEIVVVVKDKADMQLNGRFKLLQKPFYCLPVVNILNAGTAGAEHSQGAAMSCPGVRVLVVDDEPMNLMVAEGIFKGYQMVVQTAQSGLKAIELCEHEKFDLIFLDHMMPEMDGVETLKKLRKAHPDSKEALTVVAFTANAVSGAREMFLEEGFDEFISKPMETTELERVLRKLLPKSAIVYGEAEDLQYGNETEDVSLIREAKAEEAHREREENDYDKLSAIGIDPHSGMQYCQGDFAFYKELLIRFAKDSREKIDSMERYFAAEDWDNYRILVHALKSSSKMIGEDTLSEMAKAGESAAKEHDAEYIHSHHAETMQRYKRLADAIQKLFGEAKEEPDEADLPAADEAETTISKDEFLQLLMDLKDCFATFEGEKAAELIEEKADAVFDGTYVGRLLDPVLQAVDDFEFDDATQKADEIIQKMEGGELS